MSYICKKNLSVRFPISLCIILFLFSCRFSNGRQYDAQLFSYDSTLVFRFIKQGDSIYAQKSNLNGFSKSLALYDSAWQVAVQTKDTSLIAQAVYAKGRAYDAINNNPQKTIDYYTEAARLFSTINGKQNKALHIKHLVAHSYDKVQDSANCIRILNELFGEIITKPDSTKKQLRFTVEMALVSTVVKNYTLADSILQYLTKREWVKNDSTEYDYLDHYYLIKAKIDALHNHDYKSNFIDSLESVFAKSKNLSDSMYYSFELWRLYKGMGNKDKVGYYLQINNEAYNRFSSPESVRETNEKLAKMEVAAVEAKQKAEQEKAETRKWFIYILTGLLGIISLLAIFLNKRNKEIRHRQKEMANINQQMHQKNLQNELLNKEIHHRVKNNLQMIMSLVYMQESNTDTAEVKENMQNIRLRIESIANLHQQLMEQTQVVDLKKYIQYLVTNATRLMADDRKVSIHLQVEPIQVPQKISFPLGLIINEWVTNSVKHAKPASGMMEIAVAIFNSDNLVKVSYHDNGAPQTERVATKSLGLEIVNILVAQLEGRLETKNNNLFAYQLTIPLADGE